MTVDKMVVDETGVDKPGCYRAFTHWSHLWQVRALHAGRSNSRTAASMIKRKRAYTKAVQYSKATVETLQIYKSEVDWTVRCEDKLLNDANGGVLWVLHPEVPHDVRHCNVQLQLSNTTTCRRGQFVRGGQMAEYMYTSLTYTHAWPKPKG